MPKPKKKKARKKYKDVFDLIANASDDEFNLKQWRVAEMDPKLGGWMIQERIKKKGYFTIGTGSDTLYIKGVEIEIE